jgi:hypothetical protein
MKKRCSKCGVRPREIRYYCRPCANAYNREYRRHHERTPEQRRKNSARTYAGSYKRRGKIAPGACEVCGSPQTEMHHDDYRKPLSVRWFCRSCHRAYHLGRGR